jgi:PAS domain S-box-containing protein
MRYAEDTTPVGKHANSFYAETAEKLAFMRQQVAEQGSWHGVLMYRRNDGSIFPGRVTVFAIYDSNGHIQATAGIARDISDELETAKALQQSEANLARA